MGSPVCGGHTDAKKALPSQEAVIRRMPDAGILCVRIGVAGGQKGLLTVLPENSLGVQGTIAVSYGGGRTPSVLMGVFALGVSGCSEGREGVSGADGVPREAKEEGARVFVSPEGENSPVVKREEREKVVLPPTIGRHSNIPTASKKDVST